MKFHADEEEGLDKERLRRMATGWAVGGFAIVVTLLVLALNPAKAFEDIPEDKVMDVALAKSAEAPKPEPKVEVRPAPAPVVRRARPPGGGGGPLTPNKIPDGDLDEVDPSKDVNPYGDAFDLGAYGSGTGRGPGGGGPIQAAKVVEKRPVALLPIAPKQVAQVTTPAVELKRGAMVYPLAAKKAKVQGTVSVRFVVGKGGEPEQIRAISGPEELRGACEDRVRNTRYQPATDKSTGQPVPVTKILRCVFRLT